MLKGEEAFYAQLDKLKLSSLLHKEAYTNGAIALGKFLVQNKKALSASRVLFSYCKNGGKSTDLLSCLFSICFWLTTNVTKIIVSTNELRFL